MKINVKTVNAFIHHNQGGNPAGVVLDADELNHDQKLAIAKKVGLSETAFVSASNQAHFKLDFYTPTRQIAHCGHATIAVFSYLSQSGIIDNGWLSKETIDGNRKINIKQPMAYMEQLAPVYSDVDDHNDAILSSLGLNHNQIVCAPKKVYTGNSFVVLGVKDESILSGLIVDLDLIKKISKQLGLIGYYIFSLKDKGGDVNATTRMFAPYYGIPEEAATGMAAGPLACYLHDILNIKKSEYNLTQGHFMNPKSPSLINVRLLRDDGVIKSLMAGGQGKITKEHSIEI